MLSKSLPWNPRAATETLGIHQGHRIVRNEQLTSEHIMLRRWRRPNVPRSGRRTTLKYPRQRSGGNRRSNPRNFLPILHPKLRRQRQDSRKPSARLRRRGTNGEISKEYLGGGYARNYWPPRI